MKFGHTIHCMLENEARIHYDLKLEMPQIQLYDVLNLNTIINLSLVLTKVNDIQYKK